MIDGCLSVKRQPPSLALHLLALSDLGRETSLDGRYRTSRTAGVAGDEVETVFALVQLCVGGLARLAGDIFDYFFC